MTVEPYLVYGFLALLGGTILTCFELGQSLRQARRHAEDSDRRMLAYLRAYVDLQELTSPKGSELVQQRLHDDIASIYGRDDVTSEDA